MKNNFKKTEDHISDILRIKYNTLPKKSMIRNIIDIAGGNEEFLKQFSLDQLQEYFDRLVSLNKDKEIENG